MSGFDPHKTQVDLEELRRKIAERSSAIHTYLERGGRLPSGVFDEGAERAWEALGGLTEYRALAEVLRNTSKEITSQVGTLQTLLSDVELTAHLATLVNYANSVVDAGILPPDARADVRQSLLKINEALNNQPKILNTLVQRRTEVRDAFRTLSGGNAPDAFESAVAKYAGVVGTIAASLPPTAASGLESETRYWAERAMQARSLYNAIKDMGTLSGDRTADLISASRVRLDQLWAALSATPPEVFAPYREAWSSTFGQAAKAYGDAAQDPSIEGVRAEYQRGAEAYAALATNGAKTSAYQPLPLPSSRLKSAPSRTGGVNILSILGLLGGLIALVLGVIAFLTALGARGYTTDLESTLKAIQAGLPKVEHTPTVTPETGTPPSTVEVSSTLASSPTTTITVTLTPTFTTTPGVTASPTSTNTPTLTPSFTPSLTPTLTSTSIPMLPPTLTITPQSVAPIISTPSVAPTPTTPTSLKINPNLPADKQTDTSSFWMSQRIDMGETPQIITFQVEGFQQGEKLKVNFAGYNLLKYDVTVDGKPVTMTSDQVELNSTSSPLILVLRFTGVDSNKPEEIAKAVGMRLLTVQRPEEDSAAAWYLISFEAENNPSKGLEDTLLKALNNLDQKTYMLVVTPDLFPFEVGLSAPNPRLDAYIWVPAEALTLNEGKWNWIKLDDPKQPQIIQFAPAREGLPVSGSARTVFERPVKLNSVKDLAESQASPKQGYLSATVAALSPDVLGEVSTRNGAFYLIRLSGVGVKP